MPRKDVAIGGRTSATRKGNGPGWGGEAKGAAVARGEQAPPFEPGNRLAAIPYAYRDMSKAQRLDALAERKWNIAMGLVPDAQPVMVAAATSFENRELGLPVARNINVETDDLDALTDADLERERAELAALRAGSARAAADPSAETEADPV